MMLNLYSVRDAKQATFGPPFISPNDAAASRSFGDVVSSGKNKLISDHAADFALYLLASFDETSGKVVVPVGGLPVHVVDASAFLVGVNGQD